MLRLTLPVAAALLLLAGCAAAPQSPVTDHPANPNASEAPTLQPSQVLALDHATRPVTQPAETMPTMQHDMNNMNSSMPGMKMPPTTAPAASQAAVYTCPMHPEVLSDKPGKCPKCGMKLMVRKEAKTPEHGEHE